MNELKNLKTKLQSIKTSIDKNNDINKTVVDKHYIFCLLNEFEAYIDNQNYIENNIKGFPEILDLDIATVEALHDNLLDKKIISTKDKIHSNYLSILKKLYHVKDLQTIEKNSLKSSFENKLNILEESNNIIFNRGEEKERQYGPIDDSLHDASEIASIMLNKTVLTDDVYAVLIALKISRLRHNKKHDTFLDGIGYMAAWERYIRKRELKDKKHKNE